MNPKATRRVGAVSVRAGAKIVVLAAGVLWLAGSTSASAAPSQPQRNVSDPHAIAAIPPRITVALRNLATRRSIIVLRTRYKQWSQNEVVRVARRIVGKWIAKKAKECPYPLPRWFFCSRPPEPQWGRGLAFAIGDQWPGEFASQWSPRNPVRLLRPGFVFWLTCWSEGARVDNGLFRSNLWYRLTDGLWVSDAWLDTGTNSPITGVAHC
jgi:hypothetical protein